MKKHLFAIFSLILMGSILASGCTVAAWAAGTIGDTPDPCKLYRPNGSVKSGVVGYWQPTWDRVGAFQSPFGYNPGSGPLFTVNAGETVEVVVGGDINDWKAGGMIRVQNPNPNYDSSKGYGWVNEDLGCWVPE